MISLYFKLCTPTTLLHIVKVRIFPILEGRYPTEEEIQKVLRYYEKYKDEIEEENGGRADKFKKGRVTYVVSKDDKIIRG